MTLTAADENSGVASTTYSLDGGPPQTYSAPFQVTGDGSHTLDFYSTDKAGNVEATNTLSFKIDATKPTLSLATPANGGIYRRGDSVAADYACDDNLWGSTRASATSPTARRSTRAPSASTRSPWWRRDLAGNTDSVTNWYYVTPTNSTKEQQLGGDKVLPGATLRAGYDFHDPGQASGDDD